MRPESVDPGKNSDSHRYLNGYFASMRPESVDPGKVGRIAYLIVQGVLQ